MSFVNPKYQRKNKILTIVLNSFEKTAYRIPRNRRFSWSCICTMATIQY